MHNETTKFGQITEAITNEIIEELQKGNVSWSTPFSTAINAGLAKNYVTGRPYTGFNQFYLSFKAATKGYQTPQYLTFKQAQDLGGNIRKGEKATAIIFWKVIEQDREAQEKQTRLYPFYYYVFNMDQVDGVTFHIPTPPPPSDNQLTNEACQDIVTGYNNGPQITSTAATPYYAPAQDKVNMPPLSSFKAESLYYSVLFHELIHSTGHSSRLDRFQKGVKPAPFGSPEYSKEELIAEMGAAFLCGLAGIYPDTRHHNAGYIDSWIDALQRDYTLIITAANKAQKAANYILGLKETNTEELGTININVVTYDTMFKAAS